jgi:hypothetical protein
MNTNRIPMARAPARIRKSKDLLGVSAITFLTLCVWIGPHAACWLIAIAAIIAGWIWLANRFPTFGWLTYVFFDGFLGGLFGYRAGYYHGPRYRRWR